jgi:hypothetical protein
VGQDAPKSIAIDGTFVYWLEAGQSGTLVQCPIVYGCHQVPWLLAGGVGPYPESLAIDEAHAYVSSLTVNRYPLVYGADPRISLTLDIMPRGVVADDTYVYFARDDSHEIVKVHKDGSSLDTTVLGTYPDGRFGMLALDATTVYWTVVDGEVMAAPKDGGQTRTVGAWGSPQHVGEAYGLAVDDTYVYWTNWTDAQYGAVLRAPKTGGDVTVLASGLDYPVRIALDADYVYWTDTVSGAVANGSVMKVAKTGGDPVVIAADQAHPYGIAVDATNLYWTNLYDGTVVMKRK